MKTHTAGKWEIQGTNINGSILIGVKGKRNSTGKIVKVNWDCCGKDSEEWKANAKLIAAAPEMLEALKYVIQWHREHDSGEGELFGLDFVTTAICAVRKAEGGEA